MNDEDLKEAATNYVRGFADGCRKTEGPEVADAPDVISSRVDSLLDRYQRLKAENQRLRDKLAGFIWNGCFDGDCPHETNDDCFAELRDMALLLRESTCKPATPNEDA
ncbi:MAG: hypothetical protein O7D91_21545 [Planctomycetota bacterium]|nr:hypothetical protein [Planctomycetota bacterium]